MAEQLAPKALAMSGTLVWEPIVQSMTGEQFDALTERMLDRLDRQGWKLVRKDA